MYPRDYDNYANDNSTIVQSFVELKMPPTDGKGIVQEGAKDEYLFELYDPEMLKYLEEQIEKDSKLTPEQKKTSYSPMYKTLSKFNVYLAFEPIQWQVPFMIQSTLPFPPELKNPAGFTWSDTQIIYGTPTNLIQYVSHRINEMHRSHPYYYTCPSETDVYGWMNWLDTYRYSVAWMNSWPFKAYKTEGDIFKLKPFSDIPANIPSELSYLFRNWSTLGYGVMYFGVRLDETDEPKTRTWDEDIYSGSNYKPGPPPVPPVDPPVPPDNPGKVPDDPAKPSDPADPGTPSNDPETPGNPDGNINIVKFYSSKNGDGTYKYLENHVREKTVRNIQIDDEPGYKVDSWFTSIDYKKPTSKTESYDNTRAGVTPSSLSGESSTTIKLPEPETTLYIRLVKSMDVVKIYETGGKVDKVKEEPITIPGDNKYPVTTPDEGYEYTGAKESPDPNVHPKKWPDVPGGTPTTDNPISLPETIQTLYIHYEKEAAGPKLIIHESELSHNFTLADVTGALQSTIRKYAKVDAPSCGYTWYTSKGNKRTCSTTMSETDSGTYQFGIHNHPSYNPQFVYKWIESNTEYSGNGKGASGFEISATPDMMITLSRSASGDKPTLNIIIHALICPLK